MGTIKYNLRRLELDTAHFIFIEPHDKDYHAVLGPISVEGFQVRPIMLRHRQWPLDDQT